MIIKVAEGSREEGAGSSRRGARRKSQRTSRDRGGGVGAGENPVREGIRADGAGRPRPEQYTRHVSRVAEVPPLSGGPRPSRSAPSRSVPRLLLPLSRGSTAPHPVHWTPRPSYIDQALRPRAESLPRPWRPRPRPTCLLEVPLLPRPRPQEVPFLPRPRPISPSPTRPCPFTGPTTDGPAPERYLPVHGPARIGPAPEQPLRPRPRAGFAPLPSTPPLSAAPPPPGPAPRPWETAEATVGRAGGADRGRRASGR